jgi:pyruvate/2-oxoglutarate dehydrogenase complex dihydrolipoamide acyltransferase (E2) component
MVDSGKGALGNLVPVHMPHLGESIVEGTVSRWLKELGEYVEADQPVLEVFTDKAVVEVPAPVTGYLCSIVVAADETVLVGSTLGVIEVTSRLPERAVPPAEALVHPVTETFCLLAPKWVADVTEPTVSRWHKGENDILALGEPILDISTQYADIQVSCPVNGTLRSVLVAVDGHVAPGDVLALIEVANRPGPG